MINTITTKDDLGRFAQSLQRSLEVALHKGGSEAGRVYFGM